MKQTGHYLFQGRDSMTDGEINLEMCSEELLNQIGKRFCRYCAYVFNICSAVEYKDKMIGASMRNAKQIASTDKVTKGGNGAFNPYLVRFQRAQNEDLKSVIFDQSYLLYKNVDFAVLANTTYLGERRQSFSLSFFNGISYKSLWY
jgi:hypothetical protein